MLRTTTEEKTMRRDAPEKNQKKIYENRCSGNKKHRQNDMRTYALKKPRQKIGYYEAAGRDTGITSIVHNTGNTSILPESSSIWNTGTDIGKY